MTVWPTLRARLCGRGAGSVAATPIAIEIVVQYTVSAFMGLLAWCADHDTPATAAEIDAIFQRLTMPGVLAGLGRPAMLQSS